MILVKNIFGQKNILYKMENLRFAILGSILSLTLSSCVLCDAEKYGLDFNSSRKRLGLIQLKKDTKLTCEDGCTSTWSYQNQAVHKEKIIKISSYGSIESEEDRYYLGTKSIVDPDFATPTDDYIRLIYSFEDKEWLSLDWGKISGMENYNVDTEILHRYIDFLHYQYNVSWDHLPAVDTTLFPLKQGN